MKNRTYIVVVALVAAFLGGAVVFGVQASGRPLPQNVEENMVLTLQLVDDAGGILADWTVAYREASAFESLSAIKALDFSAKQVTVDGGRTLALNAIVKATITGTALKDPIVPKAMIKTSDARGSTSIINSDTNSVAAKDMVPLPKEGGVLSFTWGVLSGKDKLCPASGGNGKVYLESTVEASSTGLDGKHVTGSNTAKTSMTTSCPVSGSITVAQTFYPFSAVQTNGDEARLVTMVPVPMGGFV